MKNLTETAPTTLSDYGVKVNHYLTYAQIQQIVDAVKKFDTWAERKQNIDMLVLYHATDIDNDELEEYGHDMLLQSGLIDAVNANVCNIDDVYDALDYTTSIQRSLTQIARELPKYMDKVEDVVKRGRNKIKK